MRNQRQSNLLASARAIEDLPVPGNPANMINIVPAPDRRPDATELGYPQ
jgi:hypothetical protein